MTTLSDLTSHSWTTVAYRVRASDTEDRWAWLLPRRQIALLHKARTHGSIVTAHRREPSGNTVLVAKLVCARRQTPEGFAIAGLGMLAE